MLLQTHEAANRDEVRRIAAVMDMGEPIVQLCQFLTMSHPRGRLTFEQIKPLLAKIEDDQFEGALVQMGRYFLGGLLRGDSRNSALLFKRIDALTFPCETYDKKLHFYAVIGRMLAG